MILHKACIDSPDGEHMLALGLHLQVPRRLCIAAQHIRTSIRALTLQCGSLVSVLAAYSVKKGRSSAVSQWPCLQKARQVLPGLDQARLQLLIQAVLVTSSKGLQATAPWWVGDDEVGLSLHRIHQDEDHHRSSTCAAAMKQRTRGFQSAQLPSCIRMLSATPAALASLQQQC